MRIGVDLDGVLADLHHTFATVALRLYPGLDASIVASEVIGASPADAAASDPEQVPETEPTETASGLGRTNLALSRRQTRAIWDELCRTENFWETLRETEAGIVKRLGDAADELRWEVIFLTSRPSSTGSTVQRQSQRWLTRCGFPMPSVFVVHGSRGKIADALALDVVIDDRPENCLDVVLESKARAVLIWRGPMATVPASARRLGIGVEPTVQACLDVLIEAERSAASPADFMNRLRRLLGIQIKPASSSRPR